MKKYGALRTLSWIYFIMAGIVLFFGVLSGVATAVFPSTSYNSYTGEFTYGSPATAEGIGVIVTSVVIAVTLAAFGQLLQVVLEMLANSREQTSYLRHLARREMASRKPKKSD